MSPSATEVRGKWFEEFEVGMTVASPGRTVTEADIVNFAGLSGDYNQIHVDAEFSKEQPFEQRVAPARVGLEAVREPRLVSEDLAGDDDAVRPRASDVEGKPVELALWAVLVDLDRRERLVFHRSPGGKAVRDGRSGVERATKQDARSAIDAGNIGQLDEGSGHGPMERLFGSQVNRVSAQNSPPGSSPVKVAKCRVGF